MGYYTLKYIIRPFFSPIYKIILYIVSMLIGKEDSVMKQIIRDRIEDRSTSEGFCFALHCDVCGTVWTSTPIRFSKAGCSPQTESKRTIYQALYRREYAQAFEKAVEEAAHHFNLCPLCGQIACNDCFLICDDLDMCRSCAERLQESGEPTSFVGWVVN